MKPTWKVESRKTCDCGKPVDGHRFRKFCSKECRQKSYTAKYKEKRTIWQRNRYDRNASQPSPDKVRCLICKRYYVQVGTHVVERHGMTAREYREEFELPLKRGIVPKWYREMKGEQSIEGGGVNNLKQGARFRYKKGDKRAIKNTGYKGRAREVLNLPQEIYPH